MKKLLGILILKTSFSLGQEMDSLNVEVNSIFTLSSKEDQPFWLTSNKEGILSDNSQNALLAVPVSYFKDLGKEFKLHVGITPVFRNAGSYDFQTGGSAFLSNYFSNLSYGKAYFRIGAESRPIAQYGGDLSTGSLVQTTNARPIPKLTFGTEYFNVPFTHGHFQVKGEFSHGWLERERAVENPWLHQKYFFMKLGAKFSVNAEVGLTHNSMWGGEQNGIKSKFILSDYWNVITGGITDPNTPNVGSNDTYVFGFHTGTIDLAINFKTSLFEGIVYAQKPWEDSEQISRHSFFVKYFDNKDGLFGIRLETNYPMFQNITLEHIQTKFQGGPGLPDPPPFVENIIYEDPDGCLHNQCHPYARRENYYNNFIYENGWTYYERSLGTPLFTHQKRVQNLLGEEDLGEVYGRNTVYNNRVEGFHLGLSGQLNQKYKYALKYTYTHNFGNYYAQYGRGFNEDYTGWSRFGEPYYFENGIGQSYLMVQLSRGLENKPIEINIASGADFGGINNSFGVLLGIKYRYVPATERDK